MGLTRPSGGRAGGRGGGPARVTMTEIPSRPGSRTSGNIQCMGRFACDRWRRPAQDLVLLLQQPDPALQLSKLGGLGGGHAGTGRLDVALVSQFRWQDSVIPKSAAISIGSGPCRRGHDIIAELLRMRSGTIDILPAVPSGTTDQMSQPCSRPSSSYDGASPERTRACRPCERSNTCRQSAGQRKARSAVNSD